MKLPSFKRLFSTDFKKEYKQLIDQLSVSINNGVEVLYDALNKNVSFKDNIRCTQRDVIITVDSSGTPNQTAAFNLDNNGAKVDGVIVILAQNQTNTASYPTSSPFISGSQNSSTYTISNVSGLQANNKYLLRVIAIQQ